MHSACAAAYPASRRSLSAGSAASQSKFSRTLLGRNLTQRSATPTAAPLSDSDYGVELGGADGLGSGAAWLAQKLRQDFRDFEDGLVVLSGDVAAKPCQRGRV